MVVFYQRIHPGIADMRVLLVDDDVIIAKNLSLTLKNCGAFVDHVDNGEEALELIRHYDYDIIFLDLLLPDVEGYEIIRKIRNSKKNTPIFILSGLSRSQAKIKGLTLGADDFLTKPYDSLELLARMNAVIRRSKGYSSSVISCGQVELNLDSHEVYADRKLIHLTGKEYAILELLILRKGVVLTKEAFLNHLYGGIDEPEMKIIDVFICKLRKKLSQYGAKNLIITIWGKGYMVRDFPVFSGDLRENILQDVKRGERQAA